MVSVPPLGFAMGLLLFVVSRLAVVFYLYQWYASSRYAERKAQLNGGVEAHYSYERC